MNNFEQDTSRSLGALEAGVKGIHDRLDKLNGSVARHERRISDMEQREAVGNAQDAAEDAANRTWRDALAPLVKALLILALGWAMGQKAPAILKAIGGFN